MSLSISRLALLQVLMIVYCVVAIGTILKVRFGSTPPPIFAVELRHYAAFLLVLPLLWCSWAAVEMHRPLAESGDGFWVVRSGAALLMALVILAIVGTFDAAMRYRPILIKLEPPKHSALTLRLENR
jgi:hypothetical protein